MAALQRQAIRGFGSWHEFVVQSFPWLDVDAGERDFRANVRFRTFGDGSLAAMSADACRVTRTERAARRADAGYLKVMWQRAGTMGVEQNGRRTLLTPGNAIICDTGRPYRLTLGDACNLVVLTLPYRAIIGWERLSSNVSGSELRDRPVTLAVLGASLALLDESSSQSDAGSNRVLAGISAMLSASLHHATLGRPSPGPLRMDSVRSHILTRIDDPALGPDGLAAALRVSRRTLYALFKEGETTPSRFIRDVRLEAVSQALRDPANAGKSILDIALDHGFTDSASFCRTFKSAYGISPSALRSRASQRAARPETDDYRDCP